MPDLRPPSAHAMTGLVSVVIPCFNPNERFLREAVDSVVSQTHAYWEVLLADDGCEQRGRNMLRAVAAEIGDRARVVTYDQPGNRGISAARNEGIRHAKGEYVSFLDADDTYLPRKLEVEVGALSNNAEANLVCTNTRYWYSWDSGVEDATDFVPAPGETGVFAPPGPLGRWLRGASAVPASCSITMRRETIDAVGGFENGFPGLYEDQVFLAKVCLAGAVLLVDEVTACYRQHTASMCALATAGKARQGRETFLRWLDGYVSRRECAPVELRRIIRQEIWKVRHPRLARARRVVGKVLNRRRAPCVP